MRNSMAMVWPLAAALVFGFAALAPGSAAAQSAAAAPLAAGGGFECTCRYGGRSYAQNACVCMVTPNGARLACCGKVLNNSSWTFTGDMCPTASLSVPDRPVAEGEAPASRGYAAVSWAGTR